MPLIIAGFHRSGTSLLAQLLHSAGLFVGEELLGAKPSNPYGHFEDVEVLRLHRSIMRRHIGDWQWDETHSFYIAPDQWRRMRGIVARRELEHERWGFKEPRVCLLMGAWKYVAPDAKFVIVYRDPGECVRSLEERAGADHFAGEDSYADHMRFFTEPDHGLKLWDTYNRAVVAFARRYAEDCLVIPFQRLTSDFPVVERVNERLGVGLDPVPTSSVFDPAITTSRSSPQLVHSPKVRARVEETWSALEELATVTGGK
jgi:hypothetical protein